MSRLRRDPGAPAPVVSIVVPTWNGMSTLPALFDVLRLTATSIPIEIVVVDSASTDGTLEFVAARADRVIEIAPGTFDHGLSRNRGIEAARGEFVVCLVQDAWPVEASFLEKLIAPMVANPRVAGTWARQQPRTDTPALVRHYMTAAPVTSDAPVVHRVSGPDEFEGLTPLDRMERCRFDNVCSCIRRAVWASIPFRSTPIAEDLAWARDALLAGHELVYVPEALVVHSHDRPARYEYRRTRMLHRQLADLFDVQTVPTLSALVRSIGSTLGLHWRIGTGGMRRRSRAIGLAFAWPLGQYLGARDHRMSRLHYRSRGV